MRKIIRGKGLGKTKALIAMSHETGKRILVVNEERKRNVIRMADDVDIPTPVTLMEFTDISLSLFDVIAKYSLNVSQPLAKSFIGLHPQNSSTLVLYSFTFLVIKALIECSTSAGVLLFSSFTISCDITSRSVRVKMSVALPC